ncbi:adenylylsulfate reductase [Thioalkalivibrio paradoxus ARh 1]|uniref:Adenylylsulfate reductase n=2 Tax=Thioalkalivibrio paradoxus TaxID=108010 RepID=W0DEU9_9GAMM|nr:adenylylsulfate reductase [Thioalkalivibrio paradoxus ARh 1]
MITSNPFAELAAVIPPAVMQVYVVLMVVLVVAGTILDMMHKKSAKYFFENAKKAQQNATRSVGGGEKVGIAVKTLANEVLTSGEFANPQRRMSHLLTMYGFIIFAVFTAILIFAYPAATDAPAILPLLWHLGALMLAVGGYWFWFVIRVDVSAEGNPWYRVERADLFILSLLATATFAILWSLTQGAGAIGWLFFVLFLAATTTLFATVYWSKFAHMFFKPAAAYQKRLTRADGSAENLPTLTRDDPEQQQRHSMELLRDAPMDMGLGIKREAPNHY